MSLRLKLVLALVALSAAATAAIGVFSYQSTASQLRSQVDRSLVEATRQAGERPAERDTRPRPGGVEGFRGAGDVVAQFVDPTGATIAYSGVTLPVTADDLRIAAAEASLARFSDAAVDGQPYRILTTGYGDGRGALQAGRSLAETEQLLDTLRARILVAATLVVAFAALFGSVIARQVTRRLVRLTAAAEQVSATGDLQVEVPVDGTDETGRLGGAFSEMLAVLARSKDDQQRLVQNAGHELRTPLTSLRTNVFMLRRGDELTPQQRADMLRDLELETEELTRLIDEVVELATDRRSDEPVAEVPLGALVERVAARAAQRSGREVSVIADDSVVTGRPLALERAVGNLVENALKFDEHGGSVEVGVTDGSVEVRDRGPGFADADLPHVFDRFYRSTAARSRPGSGLGLAIVADIVEQHGGTVVAGNREGGGAVVGFTLPVR